MFNSGLLILEAHLHAVKWMIILRCIVHKQLLSLKYLPLCLFFGSVEGFLEIKD